MEQIKGERSMGNHEKSFAEKTYQENFVEELKKYKWEAPEFLNGSNELPLMI